MPETSPAPTPGAPRARPRGAVPAAIAAAVVAIAFAVAALRPGGAGGTGPAAASRSAARAPATGTPAPPRTSAPRASGSAAALCVRDSVMLGASARYLGTLTMCRTVDATVGRQFSAGPAAVAAHRLLPGAVVVDLGTNGTISPGDLEALLRELAAVPRVVLVTVQTGGSRSWEGPDNALIRAAPAGHPNVRIADWKAASDGHPGWVRGDGIHLSVAGGAGYAATIAAAL